MLAGQLAANKYHEGLCKSCTFGKNTNPKYTHVIQLTNDQQAYQKLKEYIPPKHRRDSMHLPTMCQAAETTSYQPNAAATLASPSHEYH